MIKTKYKKIISLALLLVMMSTMFSVDVFAGGDISLISVSCEGVFKGCCKEGSKDGSNDKNYKFNKATGYLTILNTTTEAEPITSYLDQSQLKNVKTVEIEKGVTSIANMTFEDCTGLSKVIIPISVTSIGDRAFKDCTGLTSVTIPNRVTCIGNNAFDGCTGLTSVTIGDGVKKIGNEAFKGCIGLASVTIPEGVTTIGTNAFEYYTEVITTTKLTPISVPGTIFPYSNSIIPNNPFDDEPNKTTFKDGNLFVGKDIEKEQIGDIIDVPKDRIETILIKNSVTKIGGWAFHGCTSLKEVTIPDSVTTIGPYAFDYCTSLKEVTIPNSVITISPYAFRRCKSLTSITIPNSVTYIGEYAFPDNTEVIRK
jgi:hypothetical protein